MSEFTNDRTPFPGHGMILGPEEYSLGTTPQGQQLFLRNREDYMLWLTIIVTTKKGKVWKSPEAVDAYINYGKWKAQCFWCKSYMLTRPDWNLACCTDCGAFYEDEQLRFPSDDRIVQALLVRPQRDTQHWDNKQTAEDLIFENKEILQL